MRVMSRLTSWSAVLCLVVAIGAPALAQSQSAVPPVEISLDDALRLLKERSPRTAADQASVAVVAADRLTAKTLPNPNVSYGLARLFNGVSTGAVTQHQTGIEQPLLLFHQRQTRLNAVDANVKAEVAHVAESLADRRRVVRQTFASLLARQEQLQIVQQGLTNLERVQQLVRGRAAAGDRSQYEVLRIETETEAFRNQVMSAAADVEDVSRALAALLGIPGWQPKALGNLDVRAVPTDADALWTLAERRRPDLVALRQEEAAARAEVLMEQRERKLVPTINGGTQTTRDVNGNSFVLGVSVPLQIFDRNQGPIAKAQARVAQVELQTKASLAEARAEIDHAAAVLRQRLETRQAYLRSVGERLPNLQKMAETAYREGAADILELLDAQRSLRDYELTKVQQSEAVTLAEEAVIASAALDAEEPAQ